MSAGQGPLTPVLDTGALDRACLQVECSAVERHALHARTLRELLGLAAVLAEAGLALSSTAHIALLRQISEQAAAGLLHQAELLQSLPGALEALDCGLLTVEHAGLVTRMLQDLPPALHLPVWEQLQTALLDADRSGCLLPPARTKQLLARWIIAADPLAAEQRRERAHENGSVSYRRRDDGLVDLFAFGLTAPTAHAVLHRIRDRGRPWGAGDERTAGKRRLDAFADLLLGRDHLPVENASEPEQPLPQPSTCMSCGCGGRVPGRGGVADCGCRPGQPVPCGVGLVVHVPLAAALGTTGELAELAGHGPVEPDLLAELLTARPRLRALWVDERGTPVAEHPSRLRPGPAATLDSTRDLLRSLSGHPPPTTWHARHPDDHPAGPTPPDGRPRQRPSAAPDTGDPGRARSPALPGDERCSDGSLTISSALRPADRGRPRVLRNGHPVDTPGSYRPGAPLRRLVQARSPRCEWPGCGASAVRCDLDHDVAWPDGPTCACNLGPGCRRHHRLKQLLMTKLRTPAGVRWTDPTGRSWLSPLQHQAPAAPDRSPLPTMLVPSDVTDSPFDRDDDGETDEWLRSAERPARSAACDDTDPVDTPRAAGADTRWGHDLDDTWAWLPELAPSPG